LGCAHGAGAAGSRPMRHALPLLVVSAAFMCGCGAIATSASWVGGGMAVTGPPLAPEEDLDELEEGKDGLPVEIGARHVLVMHENSQQKPEGITRTRDEALARAKECLLKLRGGADFTEMVREYTDEPNGAERGGDLGVFKREVMVKAFSEPAFRLKVGQISEVVETSYGWHIIKRTR
jgi:NIMA-interacting peptidyl-prolyl cis-trans isomerase 1